MWKTKQYLLGLVTLILSNSLLAEMTWLPMDKSGYSADATASVIVGTTNFKSDRLGKDTVAGFELSLNCPFCKPEGHQVRQQISVTQVESNGTKIQSVELNPHHVFELSDNLTVGIGPGVAYNAVTGNDDSEGGFAVNLGVSATYRAGRFVSGVEVRRQFSQNVELNGENIDLDNTRTTFKVGMDFL